MILTEIKDRTSGIFVADEDVAETDYLVGGACNVIILLPVTSAGVRSVTVRLAKPGSRVQILGFVRLAGDLRMQLFTVQRHEAPDTTSDLIVKSVLSESASFAYHGSIVVGKGAQRADAYQRNENLLLSENSSATSSPALEIMADNVRATHGATVASLDADELWYLQSRGIGARRAAELITEGFIRSAFDRIRDEVVRDKALAAFSGLPMAPHSV